MVGLESPQDSEHTMDGASAPEQRSEGSGTTEAPWPFDDDSDFRFRAKNDQFAYVVVLGFSLALLDVFLVYSGILALLGFVATAMAMYYDCYYLREETDWQPGPLWYGLGALFVPIVFVPYWGYRRYKLSEGREGSGDDELTEISGYADNETASAFVECEACGEPNELEARFCSQCGTALGRNLAEAPGIDEIEEVVIESTGETKGASPEEIKLVLELVDEFEGNPEELKKILNDRG